jgi:hypothetical protein
MYIDSSSACRSLGRTMILVQNYQHQYILLQWGETTQMFYHTNLWKDNFLWSNIIDKYSYFVYRK